MIEGLLEGWTVRLVTGLMFTQLEELVRRVNGALDKLE